MKKYLSIICCCVLSGLLNAQDLVFSQFNHSSMLLNAARLSSERPSVQLHSRLQDSQLDDKQYFITSALSLNYPIISTKQKSSKVNLGLSVFHHQQLSSIKDYGALLGLSYKIPMKRSSLSFGLQGGVAQSNIGNSDNLFTASQFDPITGEFISGLPNGEDNLTQSSNLYSTIGFGFYWTFDDLFDREKFFLGVSGLNLNKPTITLNENFSNQSKLPIIFNVLGGLHLRSLGESNFYISPSFRWISRLSQQFLQIGSQFTYQLKNTDQGTQFQFGTWYKTNKAMVFSADIQLKRYRASFSYDLPLGNATPVWLGNGGIEFTFGVAIHKKNKRKKLSVDVVKSKSYQPSIIDITYQKQPLKKVEIKNTEISNDPIPKRNKTSRIAETIIDPPITISYHSEPNDFSEMDWTQLNTLINILNTFPLTKILITGEVIGLETKEANDEAAYDLAKKVKGYIMVNTSLRENDVVIQYNNQEKPVNTEKNAAHVPFWGIRIESIIRD